MKLRDSVIAVLMILATQAFGEARPQTTVRQNGAIIGRLFSPDGKPARGARVIALAVPANPSSSPPRQTQAQTPAAALGNATLLTSLTTTDADGRYRLSDVPAGRYYIVAGPLDAAEYFPGVRSPGGATVVGVTAGAATETGDFRLRGTPRSVSGCVVREGHESGTKVVLESPLLTYTAQIGQIGSTINRCSSFAFPFTFPEVTPGIYQVRVTPDIGPLGIAITVADKHIERLTIGVPLSAVVLTSVDVSVIVEGDAHIEPKFQFRLTPSGATAMAGVQKRVVTISGKAIRIKLPVGEYAVELVPSEPLPSGYTIQSTTVTWNGSPAERFAPMGSLLIVTAPGMTIGIRLGLAPTP